MARECPRLLPGAGPRADADPAGDVVRIDQHGHRTHLGVGKLFFPSGFPAGSDGAIYISNCSIAPATGMGPQLCPTGVRWSASGSSQHDAAVTARAAWRGRWPEAGRGA
jgi:hypothetical protein